MKISCNICYSEKAIYLTDDILNIYKCFCCNHSFTICSSDKREHYLDDYFSNKHANWFNNPNYRFFNFIYSKISQLTVNKKIKLLDVGCGKGGFLKFIKNINSAIELYGIDITNNSFPGINFLKGNFLESDIKVKFDVVCCLAVIEHVEDPQLFTKKLYDLLIPGGILVIMTDNADSLIYRISRILKKARIYSPYYRLYDYHHLHHFTNQSLKILLKKRGLDIILQKNHNFNIAAVDLPQNNFVIKKLQLLAVCITFLVSTVFKNGMLQTVICKKN